MRSGQVIQIVAGLAVILLGLVLLLAASGWLSFNMVDIAGVTLLLSGALFAVPGFVFRRNWPWLTSLFIPGALAFALGVILLYTGRAGWGDLWYLWIALLVAIGAAFVAMYQWGPRTRWLLTAGALMGTISLFLLALLLALFGSVAAARVAGAFVLIVLGLALALRGALARSSPAHLAPPHQ